jgi:hypothetical protein
VKNQIKGHEFTIYINICSSSLVVRKMLIEGRRCYVSFIRLVKNLKIISWFARCQWLTSVILATQEAEIRMIAVRSQPG